MNSLKQIKRVVLMVRGAPENEFFAAHSLMPMRLACGQAKVSAQEHSNDKALACN